MFDIFDPVDPINPVDPVDLLDPAMFDSVQHPGPQ
jgi:hypothetical protein